MKSKVRKRIYIALTSLSVLLLCLYVAQTKLVHLGGAFTPDYPKEKIAEGTDYETLLLQTGLGKPAVDKLMENNQLNIALQVQQHFFAQPATECKEIFGWFTKSDRIPKDTAPDFVDLQPGDVLLTLSTHSVGWRHGHAGLVVDESTVLECMTLGNDSELASVKHWSKYSNFAVLRVKGVTSELQEQVVAYAKENLCGVPYRLSAGLIGRKDCQPEEIWFGLQCSYLVWYAWNQFGYDLDSDGGRLVTARDLLESDLLEVVQIYGMDPRRFLGEKSN